MRAPLRIDVLTLFPGMLSGFLNESMLKRARQAGLVDVRLTDIRAFTDDAHRTVDDRPYGGGPGMVMKPGPLVRAIESVRAANSRVILMCPRGRRFDQAEARALATHPHLVLVCGHYEGVDERVRACAVDDALSIGDYVLTNGALPAAVVIDAVVRLQEGALGGEGAADEESFSEGRLEYPHYTRPPVFRGLEAPGILMSGHHAEVARWRGAAAEEGTRAWRPDLLDEKKSENGQGA